MHFITLPWRVLCRFLGDRFAQTPAALAVATLPGLVPMIAVAVAIISHLPLADSLGLAVQKFLLANFLSDKDGSIIARYVSAFAHKAERLTWVGVGGLILTGIIQMLTIEHAVNTSLKVREN